VFGTDAAPYFDAYGGTTIESEYHVRHKSDFPPRKDTFFGSARSMESSAIAKTERISVVSGEAAGID
jgi:hypothetical protein